MQLTQKQQTTLAAVQEYERDHGQQPTTYKLSKILEENFNSTKQVLTALEKKDLVKKDGKHIFAIKKDFTDLNHILDLPIYGLASCGEALAFAQDNVSGFLQVSASLFRKADPATLFAIQAVGDSMNKEGIDDKSYIVFEKYDAQELDSKVVVAVINGMATIKRYTKKNKNLVMLMPSSTNKKHKPIYIAQDDSFVIAGVFRRVLPKK